jgi:hypothetical protein
MAEFCVATCLKCAKRFRLVWRIGKKRLPPSIVIRLTCPLCGKRFDQVAVDLVMFGSGAEEFPSGRPVRHMKLIYDCQVCGKPSVFACTMYTDWPDEELVQRVDEIKCENPGCPLQGQPQLALVSRVMPEN